VLRAFVALVGMRDVGLELKGVLDALANPIKNFSRIGGFAGRKLEGLFRSPDVAVRNGALAADAQRLGSLIGTFGANVERLLRTHREEILDRQYQQGRIADAAIELYVSSCVLRRLDALMTSTQGNHVELHRQTNAGRCYLQSAERRIRHALNDLWNNDDALTTQAADALLNSAVIPAAGN
jgi:hypothetical protein